MMKELSQSFTRAVVTVALIKCVVMDMLDSEKIKTFTTAEILTPFVIAFVIVLPVMLFVAIVTVIREERNK